MRTAFVLSVSLFAAASFSSSHVAASEPAGVWIISDQVTLIPDADHPTSVRLTGIATLHSGTGPINTWGYAGFETPRRGTLYYNCPVGQESICGTEWRELREARGRCVGFGSLDVNNGKLRDNADTSATPDPYPIGIGVVVGFTPCQLLERAADGGVTEPDNDAGGTHPSPDASASEPRMPSQRTDAGPMAPPAPPAAPGGASSASTPRAPATAGATSPPAAASSADAAASPAGEVVDAPAQHVKSCAAIAVPSTSGTGMVMWLAASALVLRTRIRRRHGVR